MFSLFNFSSIFPGGSADPICPYVRTPMAQWRNLVGVNAMSCVGTTSRPTRCANTRLLTDGVRSVATTDVYRVGQKSGAKSVVVSCTWHAWPTRC